MMSLHWVHLVQMFLPVSWQSAQVNTTSGFNRGSKRFHRSSMTPFPLWRPLQSGLWGGFRVPEPEHVTRPYMDRNIPTVGAVQSIYFHNVRFHSTPPTQATDDWNKQSLQSQTLSDGFWNAPMRPLSVWPVRWLYDPVWEMASFKVRLLIFMSSRLCHPTVLFIYVILRDSRSSQSSNKV